MKFPRNARIFQGQLDAAPFASVLFLLLIFILLGSLVYTPGVRVELPQLSAGDELPGTDLPSVAVAVDNGGRFYFENRVIGREQLQEKLHEAAARSKSAPLTLLVQADQEVKEKSLIDLALLARNAGIRGGLLLATLPLVPTNSASLFLPGAP